jgi:TIR domain
VGILFISHSSRNNDPAIKVRDWLREQGWRDTFLDLDPEHGLAPGQRWQEELRKAGERCSAVIALVSPEWAASIHCRTEFLLASQLGKRVFPVLIAPTPFADLPAELTAHFQMGDMSRPEIEADGLNRLRIGLTRAGLHPGHFGWPPPGEPNRPPYRGLHRVGRRPVRSRSQACDHRGKRYLAATVKFRKSARTRTSCSSGQSKGGPTWTPR